MELSKITNERALVYEFIIQYIFRGRSLGKNEIISPNSERTALVYIPIKSFSQEKIDIISNALSNQFLKNSLIQRKNLFKKWSRPIPNKLYTMSKQFYRFRFKSNLFFSVMKNEYGFEVDPFTRFIKINTSLISKIEKRFILGLIFDERATRTRFRLVSKGINSHLIAINGDKDMLCTIRDFIQGIYGRLELTFVKIGKFNTYSLYLRPLPLILMCDMFPYMQNSVKSAWVKQIYDSSAEHYQDEVSVFNKFNNTEFYETYKFAYSNTGEELESLFTDENSAPDKSIIVTAKRLKDENSPGFYDRACERDAEVQLEKSKSAFGIARGLEKGSSELQFNPSKHDEDIFAAAPGDPDYVEPEVDDNTKLEDTSSGSVPLTLKDLEYLNPFRYPEAKEGELYEQPSDVNFKVQEFKDGYVAPLKSPVFIGEEPFDRRNERNYRRYDPMREVEMFFGPGKNSLNWPNYGFNTDLRAELELFVIAKWGWTMDDYNALFFMREFPKAVGQSKEIDYQSHYIKLKRNGTYDAKIQPYLDARGETSDNYKLPINERTKTYYRELEKKSEAIEEDEI